MNTNKVNYFQYVLLILRDPDYVITKSYKGFSKFGLINIITLFSLFFFHSFIQETLLLDRSWEIKNILISLKLVFSLFAPFITVFFLMNWVATKVIDKQSISYYLEKFGAVLFYPTFFLLTSIILQWYNVIGYPWLKNISMIFIYIGIFIVSYLFAARDNYKISALFVIGFYFASKFLYFAF
ncbi:hypothetical protein ACERII_25360 [Evansella sp. AB-rgal1]|uniref:hypothetical protein n=1 Tax=Evansella sp. AB-rgal1 TaxID=3242696 RepID=UPI00359E489E